MSNIFVFEYFKDGSPVYGWIYVNSPNIINCIQYIEGVGFVDSEHIWSLEFNEFSKSALFTGENSSSDFTFLTYIEEIQKNEIVIFPNPVIDDFMIKGFENESFNLLDYNGKVVISGIQENEFVSVNQFASGVYFIKSNMANKAVKLIVK